MKHTLFELNAEIACILDALEIDEETGEIISDTSDLDALEAVRDVKILNVAKHTKHIMADVAALKQAEKDIKHRREAAERESEYWKRYIVENTSPSDKVSDAEIKVSYRRSEAVNLTVDPMDMNPKYVVEKTTYTADRRLIKETIKSGTGVSGAELVENWNLQIK